MQRQSYSILKSIRESFGFLAGSLPLPQCLEYSSDFMGKNTWRVWAWQMVAGHTCQTCRSGRDLRVHKVHFPPDPEKRYTLTEIMAITWPSGIAKILSFPNKMRRKISFVSNSYNTSNSPQSLEVPSQTRFETQYEEQLKDSGMLGLWKMG